MEAVPGGPLRWDILNRILSPRILLQGLEERANFRARPVLCADKLAADDALTIDDVGLGPLFGVVELCGGLFGVADGDQVNVAASEEAAVRIGIVVDGNGENGQVGLVVVEIEQGRHLGDAGGALRPPEIEQNDAAAVSGEMNGSAAVGDVEIWSRNG